MSPLDRDDIIELLDALATELDTNGQHAGIVNASGAWKALA